MTHRLPLLLVTLSLGLSTAACVRVKAHQREVLARPAMQAPVWTQQSKATQHVFQVREASSGATGSAGGGCGCN